MLIKHVTHNGIISRDESLITLLYSIFSKYFCEIREKLAAKIKSNYTL